MRYVARTYPRMILVTPDEHGFCCPSCSSTDTFRISYRGFADVFANGADPNGDVEWEPLDDCECRDCRFSGPVVAFTWEPCEPLVFREVDGEMASDVAFTIRACPCPHEGEPDGDGVPGLADVTVVREVLSRDWDEVIWHEVCLAGDVEDVTAKLNRLFPFASVGC